MGRLGHSTIPYLILEKAMARNDRIDLIEDIQNLLQTNPSVAVQFIVLSCSGAIDFMVAFAVDPPRDDLVSHLELTLGNYGAKPTRVQYPFSKCSRDVPVPQELGYPYETMNTYFSKYTPAQLAIERFYGPGQATEDDERGECIYTAFVTYDPGADAFRTLLGHDCYVATHRVPYELDYDLRHSYDYIRRGYRNISIQELDVNFPNEMPADAPTLSPGQVQRLIMPPDPAALSPSAREHVHHFDDHSLQRSTD